MLVTDINKISDEKLKELLSEVTITGYDGTTDISDHLTNKTKTTESDLKK